MNVPAVLALTLLMSPAAFSQRETFHINADASDVTMTLRTTHEVVKGTFRVQDGAIQFDRNTATMSGSVTVLTSSGKTGNDSRDKKMKKSILQVDQYATTSFTPKTYTGNLQQGGPSTIQVTGVFTLLGMSHNLTIPIQILVDGSKATAKAHFIVPYVQWGLKNPSFLFWKAEDDVAIDLTLIGTISN